MRPLVLTSVIVLFTGLVVMAQAERPAGPVQVSEPVVPTVTVAVRDLPDLAPEPELYGLEMKRREDYGFIPLDFPVEPRIDPLLGLQRGGPRSRTEAFSTLIHSYDGVTSSSSPPDDTGDVGSAHFLQAVNLATSAVRVVRKSDGVNLKQFYLQSLASGTPCSSGYCDPIVLYDRIADRWLISEFPSSGGHLCVYVSTTSDPTGTWYYYPFLNVETSTPDYPKYGVWPQGATGGSYLVGINASTTSGMRDVVALDRAKMLAGLPATFQKFTVPVLPNSGFQLVLPATLQGPLAPPDGSPALFMRPRDDEAQDGANTPTYDLMEMWALTVDWATPADSGIAQLPSLHIGDYDMTLCGMGNTWNCMPQPGTTQKIDPSGSLSTSPSSIGISAIMRRSWAASSRTWTGPITPHCGGSNSEKQGAPGPFTRRASWEAMHSTVPWAPCPWITRATWPSATRAPEAPRPITRPSTSKAGCRPIPSVPCPRASTSSWTPPPPRPTTSGGATMRA